MKKPTTKLDKTVTRKLIANKGLDSTECVKVLGNLTSLYTLADFWERNAGNMHLVGTNGVLEFVEEEEFDSEQMDAFRKGLTVFPLFFQKCLEERQRMELQKRQIPVDPDKLPETPEDIQNML